MTKTLSWIVLGVLAFVIVGGWGWYEVSHTASPGTGAGIANPASVHCTKDLGGTLEIIDTPQGQVGMCHLKDGRVCEEWELLRSGQCVNADGSTVASSTVSYKDATYTIDGKPVTLVNGRASVASAPGSASHTVTQYFGNEATGDLNGDGVPDVAFILTQDGGGSGTFYYVVAAIASSSGYVGTNAVLLGDRIAPQTTEIKNGEIIVNYADRKPSEPMSAKPSVGVSMYLRYVHGRLEAQ